MEIKENLISIKYSRVTVNYANHYRTIPQSGMKDNCPEVSESKCYALTISLSFTLSVFSFGRTAISNIKLHNLLRDSLKSNVFFFFSFFSFFISFCRPKMFGDEKGGPPSLPPPVSTSYSIV
jgi:hypothetical protein